MSVPAPLNILFAISSCYSHIYTCSVCAFVYSLRVLSRTSFRTWQRDSGGHLCYWVPHTSLLPRRDLGIRIGLDGFRLHGLVGDHCTLFIAIAGFLLLLPTFPLWFVLRFLTPLGASLVSHFFFSYFRHSCTSPQQPTRALLIVQP